MQNNNNLKNGVDEISTKFIEIFVFHINQIQNKLKFWYKTILIIY